MYNYTVQTAAEDDMTRCNITFAVDYNAFKRIVSRACNTTTILNINTDIKLCIHQKPRLHANGRYAT